MNTTGEICDIGLQSSWNLCLSKSVFETICNKDTEVLADNNCLYATYDIDNTMDKVAHGLEHIFEPSTELFDDMAYTARENMAISLLEMWDDAAGQTHVNTDI